MQVEQTVPQKAKAQVFRELHLSKHVFVLPNAWDVPSARLYEDLGFPAVATSSAGLMVSQGFPDGQEIPWRTLVSVIEKISRTIHVPLSADLVAGFGSTPADVAGTVKSVVEAGAVGVNIEDFEHSTKKLFRLEDQVRKLRAVKDLYKSINIPFVLNARTDAFRFGEGSDESRLEEAPQPPTQYSASSNEHAKRCWKLEHSPVSPREQLALTN